MGVQVTFANICKMFISMEPSPLTDKIDQWFGDLLYGLRAYPFDFPGTASHGARKVFFFLPLFASFWKCIS